MAYALKSRFLSRSRSRSRSRRQKSVSLDVMDNLDGFQKLVSTRRTFSISISIGLDVETTRLRENAQGNKKTLHTFLILKDDHNVKRSERQKS